MNIAMQTICTNLDVCLVPYYTNKSKEEQYLKDVKNYFIEAGANVYIHDNTLANIGLSKARNKLIKNCKSEVVCLIDFDIEIINIDIPAIMKKLQQKDVGIVSPVTERFSRKDKNLVWQEKEYLACNCMFIRRDTFDRIGLLDESFFVAYADWDLIKRVLNADLKIYQHNLSNLRHFGFSRNNPNKGPIWRRDFKQFVKKWGPDGVLDRTKK
tara:strand:- start:8 stop:643 length:636 start_codon:yes stop_codon:yes gene_type:complete